ncbi:S4 domain-containing protein [Candidatus Annandia adelgestsuga]|uniref:S4 domain-containing protein n=1 Tax=Candidatus Annandia adelgestsuga TaxID=1302411 RepID=UPI000F7F62FF|nr:S4 domain-containing protein [Candidatus Annandia adelgestsuga]
MKTKIIKIKLSILKIKKRLDYVLSKILSKFSRSYIKYLIINKKVKLNNNIVNKPNTYVSSYDKIKIFFIIIIINIYFQKI